MKVPAKPRRAALLCTHFARNLAYYRAGWKENRFIFPENDLWKTLNGNFLDIAVIEWCKIFADRKAYHSWVKVVVDPTAFLSQMLFDAGSSNKEWQVYLDAMRTYRDKFVAHLDREKSMNIPIMDVANFSIRYLYDTLRAEQDSRVFAGLPTNLGHYFEACKSEAADFYDSAA